MQTRKYALLPILFILFSSAIVPHSFASVESEAQEDIQAGCPNGEVMVYRTTSKQYVCVIPSTADRWVELGLANTVSEYPKPSETKSYEIVAEDEIEIPTSPPLPPKKQRISQDDSECRDGYTLIYRFIHHDTFCTSPSTALSWERLGLAEIINDEKNIDEGKQERDEQERDEQERDEQERDEQERDEQERDEQERDEQERDEQERDEQERDEQERDEQERDEQERDEQERDEQERDEQERDEQERDEQERDEQERDEQERDEQERDNESTFSYSSNIPRIYQLRDGIWVAVGYDSTNSLLIEGDSGIIVIDTLTSYESAKKLLDDFRILFSDKPIKTIIYTQENSDLLLGSKAFLEEGDGSVEIIAPEDLQAYFSDSDNSEVIPTHLFQSEFLLDISGVKIKLVFGIGEEFSDQTYIFLTDEDGLLIGDSIYGVTPYILDMKYLRYLDDS
ncbi:hypothetical protein C5F49_05145 [Nitrosopumilus oxyclinae]|uniref:Metallo-beta-lactamase domain-containing protein n=1 Tax=Nitrosopumilus oxyclinae TaxID=1959104 RepID=A0A7D5M4P6_9ARCH|nr:MBL fold metallo-hydrolase [Nitrosopumilus oxyclinae]QLH04767.1 hypothetical protein C5F49_05145 [Nitrosopumilus oxyclinae]